MVKTIIPSECPDCGLSPKHTFCYREDFVIYGTCFRCGYTEVIQRIERSKGPEWMNRKKSGRPNAKVISLEKLLEKEDTPPEEVEASIWDDTI